MTPEVHHSGGPFRFLDHQIRPLFFRELGLVVASSHWEGAATGFGAVFGTLSVPLEGGATGGPCTWLGQAFLDDGTWVTGVGEGTWQQVEGEHRWKFSFPAIEISNGDRIRSEGEIDLETRVFAG